MKKFFGRKIRNLIAEFRGLPTEQSHSFLKKPHVVGDAVCAILKRFDMHAVRPENIIQDNWADIIGIKLVKYCEPLKITLGDVLIVKCPSAVVRSELQILKGKILESLHKFAACKKISDVRFVANG